MRRNTKTMYEWRKAYRDKEELMLERGFPEVSPHEFYRDFSFTADTGTYRLCADKVVCKRVYEVKRVLLN